MERAVGATVTALTDQGTAIPFFVDGNHERKASELRIGDKIIQEDGGNAILTSSHREEHEAGIAVYNFEVEGFHTYFVSAHGSRAPPVWVHNSDCKPVLLGRLMSRVIPVATSENWKYYVPLAVKQGRKLPEVGTEEFDNAVKANGQWIRDQIKAGRRLYDIAGDSTAEILGLAAKSPYYEAEKKVLRSMGYTRNLIGTVKASGKTFALFEWIK